MAEEAVVESVNAPDSQAGDVEPTGDAGGAPEPREENSIPHSRVEEMIAQRVTKAQAEWEAQKLAPIKKQYDDMQQRFMDAEIARMERLGLIERKQPQNVTQEQIEKMLAERDQKYQEQAAYREYSSRIQMGWETVAGRHPELARLPSYQNAVLAKYAEDPRQRFADVGEEVAKDYEAFFASKSNALAKQKEKDMRPDRRVMPSGRGAGGGTGSTSDKKKTIAEKIRERLAETREE